MGDKQINKEITFKQFGRMILKGIVSSGSQWGRPNCEFPWSTNETPVAYSVDGMGKYILETEEDEEIVENGQVLGSVLRRAEYILPRGLSLLKKEN